MQRYVENWRFGIFKLWTIHNLCTHRQLGCARQPNCLLRRLRGYNKWEIDYIPHITGLHHCRSGHKIIPNISLSLQCREWVTPRLCVRVSEYYLHEDLSFDFKIKVWTCYIQKRTISSLDSWPAPFHLYMRSCECLVC